ncbi:TetR/AcrR family transcriptional regulator [Paenibacillus taichungensis]|uniref:TetR/AcrR family transcriptional regulator n=1 Tax=Paenibacillus taichungensis TaxID=484184 RepID=UPI0039A157C3
MSPRNILKDQQMRKERIEHILNSALQTMAKRGIDSTNIKDIAKEAKLSVGNIYTYFTSKDEIFSEVLRRGQTMYGRTIAQIADMDIDPREKLFEISKGWLSNESNWAFTIMLQSIRTNQTVSTEIKQAATQRFTDNLEPLAEIFRQGQEAGGIIQGDTRQLAFYFVSLIQGLTLQLAPGYEIQVDIDPKKIVRLFMEPETVVSTAGLFEGNNDLSYINKKMFDR